MTEATHRNQVIWCQLSRPIFPSIPLSVFFGCVSLPVLHGDLVLVDPHMRGAFGTIDFALSTVIAVAASEAGGKNNCSDNDIGSRKCIRMLRNPKLEIKNQLFSKNIKFLNCNFLYRVMYNPLSLHQDEHTLPYHLFHFFHQAPEQLHDADSSLRCNYAMR